MERSESFKYHSQVVVRIPAKSQNSVTASMSTTTVPSEVPSSEDQSEATSKSEGASESASDKAGYGGKRRSLEGRVIRGTKGKRG